MYFYVYVYVSYTVKVAQSKSRFSYFFGRRSPGNVFEASKSLVWFSFFCFFFVIIFLIEHMSRLLRMAASRTAKKVSVEPTLNSFSFQFNIALSAGGRALCQWNAPKLAVCTVGKTRRENANKKRRRLDSGQSSIVCLGTL